MLVRPEWADTLHGVPGVHPGGCEGGCWAGRSYPQLRLSGDEKIRWLGRKNRVYAFPFMLRSFQVAEGSYLCRCCLSMRPSENYSIASN